MYYSWHPRGKFVSNALPSELDRILSRLISLQLSSREDMIAQLTELLGEYQVEIRDRHNTSSIIFTFIVDTKHYGLKIEYGSAEVTRNEAHWYELAPAELKTHYVISHDGENYAFILLRWLTHAQTIEEIAIANEGNSDNPTIDLVLQVLSQDKMLFDSAPSITMQTSRDSSYFLNKYRAYNARAVDYPYLQALLDADTVRLNDRELPGPERFVQAVQQDDELRVYLSPDRAGLIQGDPHMDNVLVEDGVVYFVDPKGVDHLPLEYDTGRVIWSLTGWNAIVRGEFTFEKLDDGYRLGVVGRQQYIDGLPRVRAYFSEQEYHRAVYSAAMQYLTRVSHAAHEPEATALYLRGLELFADLFEELGKQA